MLMIISGHVFCIPVLCRGLYEKAIHRFLKECKYGEFCYKITQNSIATPVEQPNNHNTT